MKNVTFSLLVCLIGLSSMAQEVINGSITHDGLQRDYILYVPDSYSAGNPLVMNFHGYTSNAMEQMEYGNFQDLADEYGFLLVHPDGTEDLTGSSHWNVGWGFSTVDDVGFASALIDSLHAEYSINLDRVYSTGMSNGGFFSYHLACNLSDRIAAIASVTGAMSSGAFDSCAPSHPMPVMEIHGTADATVAYNGTFAFESVEDILAYWTDFNGIVDGPLIIPVPDIAPNDGCTAEHWLYEGGMNGSSVEHYKIIDGGHTWPGSDFVIGTTNLDIDASYLIWEFFNKYDINGLLLVDDLAEEREPLLELWPNPVQDELNIRYEGAALSYRLVDLQGREVSRGNIASGQTSISLVGLDAGVYSFLLANGTNRMLVIL